MISLSIIIPVYNEAQIIQQRLTALREIVTNNVEIIVVDGDSEDDSLLLASKLADQAITSSKGRSLQMNAGAKVAKGRHLLFLHIDTQLPTTVMDEVPSIIESDWGFFFVSLSGDRWEFRMIEFMMNLRSRLTSVATGDQCLFIAKELFDQYGGYKAIPLMEDVDISKRLRKIQKPHIIKKDVVTSSRRWETLGIWKTVILMWRLRWAFFTGVDPQTFAKRYYPKI